MNSFTVFQTKEETQLAVAVHQNAQIDNVRLARAKVAADGPGKALTSPIALSMGVKAKDIVGPPGQLLIEVAFRLSGRN